MYLNYRKSVFLKTDETSDNEHYVFLNMHYSKCYAVAQKPISLADSSPPSLPIKSDLMLFAEQHDFSYKTNDHSSLLTWFPLGHHKNNMHKSDECDIE